MEFELPDRFSEGLGKDVFFIGVMLIIVIGFMGINNLRTPADSMEVGMTHIHTDCFGIEAGVCLGLKMHSDETHNPGYGNYTEPEPGTDNYFNLAESELMLQAYNICENPEVSGMDWTDEASYKNMTGSEWLEEDEVELLPCEETTYLRLDS